MCLGGQNIESDNQMIKDRIRETINNINELLEQEHLLPLVFRRCICSLNTLFARLWKKEFMKAVNLLIARMT
jgi:hypothetical protein